MRDLDDRCSMQDKARMDQCSGKGKDGIYACYVKRLLDIFFSSILLIFLSPLFLAVAVLVRVKLGSPVIFRQARPGKNGVIFEMCKFRTMLPPQTRDGHILDDKERLACIEQGVEIISDEERLTYFGRLLRSTSIDELPELWNILKGDMSFVGPRPLATIYLPYYTCEEMRRHDVSPGLTGLAQVHGRNSPSWEERFSFDLDYVNSVSLRLDLKILFRTIVVVLRRDDIGQGAERPESFNVVRQREWQEQKEEGRQL